MLNSVLLVLLVVVDRRDEGEGGRSLHLGEVGPHCEEYECLGLIVSNEMERAMVGFLRIRPVSRLC